MRIFVFLWIVLTAASISVAAASPVSVVLAILFSGFELGKEIMTGAGLRKAPAGTPVRRAYELFNGLHNRESWDQTAVLYAVRGIDGGLADY